MTLLDGISPWWWVALAILLAAAEMVTITTVLVWAAVAALITAILLWLGPGPRRLRADRHLRRPLHRLLLRRPGAGRPLRPARRRPGGHPQPPRRRPRRPRGRRRLLRARRGQGHRRRRPLARPPRPRRPHPRPRRRGAGDGRRRHRHLGPPGLSRRVRGPTSRSTASAGPFAGARKRAGEGVPRSPDARNSRAPARAGALRACPRAGRRARICRRPNPRGASGDVTPPNGSAREFQADTPKISANRQFFGRRGGAAKAIPASFRPGIRARLIRSPITSRCAQADARNTSASVLEKCSDRHSSPAAILLH